MAQGIAWLGVTEVGPGSVLGGIYVDATQIRPADFREVRERIDRPRRSHYLDGPNDVDWIFRNQLFSQRRFEQDLEREIE